MRGKEEDIKIITLENITKTGKLDQMKGRWVREEEEGDKEVKEERKLCMRQENKIKRKEGV